ncbi:hypothetical protein Nmel_015832, partial [Mimus melanotis]
MRLSLGHLIVKAQALFLSMGSFSVHLCWVSLCRGRDVVGPGILHFVVMNLCLSKPCSSMGLGEAGAEGNSEEPDPTVLAVPLEGREHPYHAKHPIYLGLSTSHRCGFDGMDYLGLRKVLSWAMGAL